MKPRFKHTETGFHKYATVQLAEWVGGAIEHPISIDGSFLFVPDVVTMVGPYPDTAYEIVYSNPLNGKKLGLIEYYCYRNKISLTVHEIDAMFILAQTKKPEYIPKMQSYYFDYNTSYSNIRDIEQCSF